MPKDNLDTNWYNHRILTNINLNTRRLIHLKFIWRLRQGLLVFAQAVLWRTIEHHALNKQK